MKKYANFAFYYAIAAMVFGVFYREFTKFNHFTGKTTLSVMHTHYFMLGMFLCLLLVVLEKTIRINEQKMVKPFWLLFNIGLNITGGAMLVRGILQVLATPLSRAIDMSISGIAGIGHALLGTGIVLLLLAVRKQAAKN